MPRPMAQWHLAIAPTCPPPLHARKWSMAHDYIRLPNRVMWPIWARRHLSRLLERGIRNPGVRFFFPDFRASCFTPAIPPVSFFIYIAFDDDHFSHSHTTQALAGFINRPGLKRNRGAALTGTPPPPPPRRQNFDIASHRIASRTTKRHRRKEENRAHLASRTAPYSPSHSSVRCAAWAGIFLPNPLRS